MIEVSEDLELEKDCDLDKDGVLPEKWLVDSQQAIWCRGDDPWHDELFLAGIREPVWQRLSYTDNFTGSVLVVLRF